MGGMFSHPLSNRVRGSMSRACSSPKKGAGIPKHNDCAMLSCECKCHHPERGPNKKVRTFVPRDAGTPCECGIRHTREA